MVFEWITRQGIEQCHSNAMQLNGQIKVSKICVLLLDTCEEMWSMLPPCNSLVISSLRKFTKLWFLSKMTEYQILQAP